MTTKQQLVDLMHFIESKLKNDERVSDYEITKLLFLVEAHLNDNED